MPAALTSGISAELESSTPFLLYDLKHAANRIMKIYTKTGDSGTTGLFAGPRVAKDHPRISAYGTVDELNAVLGLVCAEFSSVGNLPAEGHKDLAAIIQQIQHDLFSIGAQLATPDAAPSKTWCSFERLECKSWSS